MLNLSLSAHDPDVWSGRAVQEVFLDPGDAVLRHILRRRKMLDIQTADYEELKSARQQINQRIQELERSALQELEQRAAQFGFTLLKNGYTPAPAKRVKYRGPNGEEWSGKGKRPTWLKQAIEEGHSPEEFAV